MLRFLRTPFIALLMICLFPGCAAWDRLFKHKKKSAAIPQSEKIPKPKQLIGTITLVNTDIAYALIDNGSQPSPAAGTKVECRSPDGTIAQLRVTEIRKRPFIVADIVSGTPHKGDEVYQ
jgi:hypothetical protein